LSAELVVHDEGPKCTAVAHKHLAMYQADDFAVSFRDEEHALVDGGVEIFTTVVFGGQVYEIGRV